MHGGKSPGAPIKTGRYSKYVPERLQGIIELASQDPDLVSLRKQIEVVEALFWIKLSCTGGSVSTDALADAKAHFDDAAAAITSGDASQFKQSFQQVGDALDLLRDNSEAEAEVRKLAQEKAKLSTAEIRRQEALNAYVSAQQVSMLIMKLSEIINRHVTAPDVLAAIRQDIVRLCDPEVSGIASPA